MNHESKNPWLNLSMSKKGTYIAEQDKEFFSEPKNQKRLGNIQLNVLPEPYVGKINKAKIVFLLLNPGYREGDDQISRPGTDYFRENKLSLIHESNPPFYVLDAKLKKSGGYKWWNRILNPLMKEGVSHKDCSEKIMCIQYFPYHSVKYHHFSKPPPSQKYSDDLVKQAIAKKKMIVMMRSERKWLERIPELQENYIKILNYRNPMISRNNMNPGDFDAIVKLLKS